MLSVGRYVLVIYESSQKLSYIAFDDSYFVSRNIRQKTLAISFWQKDLRLIPLTASFAGKYFFRRQLPMFLAYQMDFLPSITMYQMSVFKGDATELVHRKFIGIPNARV